MDLKYKTFQGINWALLKMVPTAQIAELFATPCGGYSVPYEDRGVRLYYKIDRGCHVGKYHTPYIVQTTFYGIRKKTCAL